MGLVGSLGDHKAPGHDVISNTLMKIIAPYLIEPFVDLVNSCLSQGFVPHHFKISLITPIHKGGHKSDPGNYRPISTISVLAKLFEKVLCSRLVKYLDKYRILSELQFDFRQGRSTADALNVLMESLYGAVDNAKIISFADDTCLVFEQSSWEEVKNKTITDLNTVKRWFDWNMLSVNMKKTHFLPISLTINSLPDYDYLCFDGDRINRVEFTRYLGVYVDCHPRWDIHSVELHKRLRKILYKIRIAREILPWDMRYTVYYALLQSVHQYGISAWGDLVGRYYLIIERAQKRLLKVLFEKPILFSTEMLFRELRILDPRQLYLETLITSISKQA
ncbi:uncharacterized protein LOC123671552 [Harmonia axyridis]|uniref:uncharacterized protein LOC123671552 n=1 Tax=Harmonia axyridis TaxID=115357 RepID=UPI001E275EC5|nr:uncharacterized protein LOC123671552 [Harmonia axyridis]